MLEDYFNAIKEDNPTQKLLLIGHSAGCLQAVELGYKLQKVGFGIQLILLDGDIKFTSKARQESYDELYIEGQDRILLWALEKLYTLSYQENFDTDASIPTKQCIANYLFPDDAIDEDYKLKVAEGFSRVFFEQGHLQANITDFESFGGNPPIYNWS
ncbi:MAG: hypothetical protein NXI01_08710 [Gammaproteobacteria bacterium]|nr:hypothetical protein [Gammaproteobacteria bacterium]